MKFKVKYVAVSSFRAGKTEPFYGHGAIHLLETGVLAEGWRPQLSFPLLTEAAYMLLCAQSALTIPYARISRYQPPGLLRRFHTIQTGLRDDLRRLTFRVVGRDQAFIERLTEYRDIARSPTAGR